MHIKQREGNWIVNTGHIQTISFTNAIFTNITGLDETDESSGILLINTLNLDSEFDIQIKNILINDSSTNFISFGSITNTPPNTKYLMMNNFTYINSYIETDRKLLLTDGIEVDKNLVIVFSQITFTQISFYNIGSLISFGHRLSDYVQVTGLVISNITAGHLHFESTNKKNTDLLTRVSINDSNFDNINDQFSSLIITSQGGRLNVTNSSFTNIYTFEEGSVVFAGPTASEVNFYDVVFLNNSAVTGALFYIQAESVVR